MTPSEQFTAWRGELIQERTSVLEQLDAARRALQVAERRYADEREAWQALNAFLGEERDRAIELPLHARLLEARDPLKAAEGERGGALVAVKVLEARAAELHGAVDQVTRIVAANKITELRPPAGETSRRRHQPPVDYETIEHPAQAAAPV